MRFKLGLVDADFLKYLVAYDVAKALEAGMSQEHIFADLGAFVEKRIKEIEGNVIAKTDKLIYLFSGKTKDNFRSAIATHRKYKSGRRKEPKYEGEYAVMQRTYDYIKANYITYLVPELEADDLCTMVHQEGTFIYSNDKDLRNSPGWHYDIKNNKFIYITEEEGLRSLLKQTMTGDSVDSIPGAEGVGPKRAEIVIKEYKEIDATIYNTIKVFLSAKKGTPKEKLDRFVEMYSLVNLKTSKGEWLKEKYIDFFNTINNLINDAGK